MTEQLCQIDTKAATKSRWSRRSIAAVRWAGWAGLVVGVLVLAVRVFRAVVEGVHSVPWAAILFLAPLSYLALGALWVLCSKQLELGRWYQGASLAAVGIALIVAGRMSTNWLYDQFESPHDSRLISNTWVDIRIPATSISVSIPYQPELEKQNIDTVVGTIPIVFYTTEQRNVVLMIGISDYPRGTVGTSEAEGTEFLIHMSDSAIQSRKGSRLLQRRIVDLAPWTGLDERVEMPAGKTGELKQEQSFVAWQRYYQYADRMLQFRAMTLKSLYDADPSEFETTAEQFLDSIRIESNGSTTKN